MRCFIPNYTTMVERNGKRYLLDEDRLVAVAATMERINDHLKGLPEILKSGDYPVNEKWQRGVLFGPDFLQQMAVAEYEKWSRQVKQPTFLAEVGRRAAIASVPDEITTQLAVFRKELLRLRDGLSQPQTEEDYVCHEGQPISLAQGFEDREREACYVEVSPEIQEAADLLRSSIAGLRRLNEAGFNVRSLFDAFLGSRYAPEAYRGLEDLDLVPRLLSGRELTRDQLKVMNPTEFERRRSIAL